jgi:hypothetical protein
LPTSPRWATPDDADKVLTPSGYFWLGSVMPMTEPN